MKYRKKPVVIEAIQWNGNNMSEIMSLSADKNKIDIVFIHNVLFVHTLEGVMRAEISDYIIRGVSGELYPCKPDIFEKTYEPEE